MLMETAAMVQEQEILLLLILSLPAGTNTIKLARLYWGARVKKSDFDITLDTFQILKYALAPLVHIQNTAQHN